MGDMRIETIGELDFAETKKWGEAQIVAADTPEAREAYLRLLETRARR